MNLSDLRREFANRAAGITDVNKISDLARALESLASELEYATSAGGVDADSLRICRTSIARAGLTIAQDTCVRLQALAETMFEAAGREAIAISVAPTTKQGTNAAGEPYAPIPSGFVMPVGYDGPIGKVTDAVKRGAGAAVSAVLAVGTALLNR